MTGILFSGEAAFSTIVAGQQVMAAPLDVLAPELYALWPTLQNSPDETAVALAELIDHFTSAYVWRRPEELRQYRALIAGYLRKLPPKIWMQATRGTGKALPGLRRFAEKPFIPPLRKEREAAVRVDPQGQAMVMAPPSAARPAVSAVRTSSEEERAFMEAVEQIGPFLYKPASDIIGFLPELNRKEILALLTTAVNSMREKKWWSFQIEESLMLYKEVLPLRPREAHRVLAGMIERDRRGIVPISNDPETRENLLHFIEATRGFNPALYRMYEGVAPYHRNDFLKQLQKAALQIVWDSFGKGDLEQYFRFETSYQLDASQLDFLEFAVGLYDMAFLLEDDHYVELRQKIKYLKILFEAEERREDIPESQRGKVVFFQIRRKTASEAGEEEIQKTLANYLLSDRGEEARQALLKVLAIHAGPAPLPDSLIPRLRNILSVQLDRMPRYLLLGRGAKPAPSEPVDTFVKELKTIWNDKERLDIERRDGLHRALRRQLVHDPDIQAKIYSRGDLPADLRHAVWEVYIEPEPFAKEKIYGEILSGLKRDMQPVPSATIGVRRVKGEAYGLQGFRWWANGSYSAQLWKDPGFSFFAVTDESNPAFPRVLGVIHAHERREGNWKTLYLTDPKIAPSFLDQTDNGAFYSKLVDNIRELTKDDHYDGIQWKW